MLNTVKIPSDPAQVSFDVVSFRVEFAVPPPLSEPVRAVSLRLSTVSAPRRRAPVVWSGRTRPDDTTTRLLLQSVSFRTRDADEAATTQVLPRLPSDPAARWPGGEEPTVGTPLLPELGRGAQLVVRPRTGAPTAAGPAGPVPPRDQRLAGAGRTVEFERPAPDEWGTGKEPVAYAGRTYDPAPYDQTPYGQTPYGQTQFAPAPYDPAPYDQAAHDRAAHGSGTHDGDTYDNLDLYQARAPHRPASDWVAPGAPPTDTSGSGAFGWPNPDLDTDPDAELDSTGRRGAGRAGRRAGDAERQAFYPGRRMNLGVVLLPLRIFLGLTALSAGMGKLTNPAFFDGGDRGSMVSWLQSLDPWSLAAPLHEIAVAHPVGAGLTVAFLQIIVGVLTIFGLWQRVVAVVGAGLCAALIVTVSWRSAPVYEVPDIIYLAAWSPLIFAGAPVYSLDGRLASEAWRQLGPRSELAELRMRVLRRGAVLAAVLVGLALLIGSLLGGAVRSSQVTPVREPDTPPTNHRPGTPLPGTPGERGGRESQQPDQPPSADDDVTEDRRPSPSSSSEPGRQSANPDAESPGERSVAPEPRRSAEDSAPSSPASRPSAPDREGDVGGGSNGAGGRTEPGTTSPKPPPPPPPGPLGGLLG